MLKTKYSKTKNTLYVGLGLFAFGLFLFLVVRAPMLGRILVPLLIISLIVVGPLCVISSMANMYYPRSKDRPMEKVKNDETSDESEQ